VTSRVYVALRVKATPERAFEVFTREIGDWWVADPLFQTTPRAPGRLTLEPCDGGRLTETLANGKIFEIGRVKMWTPPERLVVSWRQANFPPGLSTEAEVRFEAVGDETRVSVEHRGFHAVPEGNAARHGFPDGLLLSKLGEWWRALLSSYREQAGQGSSR
jgi:uncharacterized protein YndB with AHSA1/START domain